MTGRRMEAKSWPKFCPHCGAARIKVGRLGSAGGPPRRSAAADGGMPGDRRAGRCPLAGSVGAAG